VKLDVRAGRGRVQGRLLGRNLGDEVLAVRVAERDNVVVLAPVGGEAVIGDGSGQGRSRQSVEESRDAAEDSRLSASLLGLVHLPGQDSTKEDTALSDSLREHSGVDTPDGRDALLLEPLAKRRVGEVVGERGVVVGHDQRRDVDVG